MNLTRRGGRRLADVLGCDAVRLEAVGAVHTVRQRRVPIDCPGRRRHGGGLVPAAGAIALGHDEQQRDEHQHRKTLRAAPQKQVTDNSTRCAALSQVGLILNNE